jgi:hypothetical protein
MAQMRILILEVLTGFLLYAVAPAFVRGGARCRQRTQLTNEFVAGPHMFESAELGNAIDKATFQAEVPALLRTCSTLRST